MDHEQGHNMIPSIDFGVIQEQQPPKKKYWLPFVKKVSLVVAAILAALLLFSLIYATTFMKIYASAMEVRQNLEEAQHKIINRDFAAAAELVSTAHQQLQEVQKQTQKIVLVRWVPWLGSQVKAIDGLLVAAIEFTDSGVSLIRLGDDITKDIRNETLIFSEISDRHKREIIQKLVEARPVFEKTKTSIGVAQEAIEKIKSSRLIPQIRDIVEPLQQYLPIAQSMIEQAVPFVEILPTVVGFDETKTYLFLLQNNHELRPTGGFIGTYGILKLRNGEIESLITDNIYNLDRAFEDDPLTLTPQQMVNRPAPEPIEIYLEQRQWALRDGNWDPDFPTTAQTAIEMYNEQTAVARDIERQIFLRDNQAREDAFIPQYLEEDFDGVIAITPEIIESILALTGPIAVDGILFTSENFQEELSFRVTYQYEQLGIEDRARKDIIKRIADEIKTRITAMPYIRLLDVVQIGIDSLQSKAILLYAKDENLQQRIIEQGWGGEIVEVDADYLFVVDTNLGSLKTDQFIDRFVNYQIQKIGDTYRATVRVKHKHNGQFAWNSTRLRSFTRIYTPKGSKLLSSQGALVNDSVQDPEQREGEVMVTEEHGKTVFGAFIATEPREEHELVLEYQLPDTVAQKIQNGAYSLLYQKQPGTSHELTVDLGFGTSIKSFMPVGNVSGMLNQVYRHTTKIHKDTWFVLSL